MLGIVDAVNWMESYSGGLWNKYGNEGMNLVCDFVHCVILCLECFECLETDGGCISYKIDNRKAVQLLQAIETDLKWDSWRVCGDAGFCTSNYQNNI